MLKPYYQDKDFILYKADSLKLLKKIEAKSIDMIFADPPYFLSSNGITCSGGKMASVNKADWDLKIDIKEKHKDGLCWDNKDKNQLQKGFRNLDYLLNYHLSKYGMLNDIIKEYFE